MARNRLPRITYTEAYTAAASLAYRTGEAWTIETDPRRAGNYRVISTPLADPDRSVLTIDPDGSLDVNPAEACLAY